MSQAIEISLRSRQPNALVAVLTHLKGAIDQGETLYTGFSTSPFHLPPVSLAIIGAGEAAGRLPDCLEQLTAYQADELQLQKNIRQALRYPVITLIAMIAVLVLMLNWVVPQFASSFKQFGAELPYLTQSLLTLSALSRHYALPIIPGTSLVVVLSISLLRKSHRWRHHIASMKLRIPWAGQIHQEGIMSRLSATLGLMLKSGVPLPQALRLTAPTALNVCFEQYLQELSERVESGTSLTEAIRLNGRFPVMIAQLIHIGEESGQLESMLDRASQLYKQRYRSNIQALTGLLEPALMTLLCAMAGVMMLAVYLPIFQLGSVI